MNDLAIFGGEYALASDQVGSTKDRSADESKKPVSLDRQIAFYCE